MGTVASVDVSKLLDKAREAVERRNYDYAIECYFQALRMNPDQAQARRELRMVEMRLAKERGASLFAKVRVLLILVKARGLYLVRKYEAAMETTEEALKTSPDNTMILMLLGHAAQKAGHLHAAQAGFEDVRTAKGGGKPKVLLEASRELAFISETLGQNDLAKQVWEEVKRLDPADPDADSHVRDLHASDMTTKIEVGVASGKEGAKSRAMLKDSDETERRQREVSEIRTADDVLVAIEDTKQDLKKRPDDGRLHGKLGDLYRRAENYAEAKKAFEEARAKDPANPHWTFKLDDLEIWRATRELNELARKQRAGDQSVKAECEKRRAALLDFRLKSYLEREKQYSTDGRIRYELGQVYFDLAESRGDLALYDQAILRFQLIYPDPQYRHEAGLRMGQGFARKGQYDLALKRLSETLASLELKDLRWKNLMYAKGETLDLAGRKPEALQTFTQIYEIDVAFRDVSQRVDRLHKEGVKSA